ncbi:hypothetical protein [Pukyongia salina]|nr:hypothetical protein [Pukyongia salina]
MEIKNLKSGREHLKPRRNYILAIYIALISAFMISYSVVTAIQFL